MIDLLINNIKQKPKKIPLFVNKKIVYLSRYADLRCLKSDIVVEGRFTISCDSITGIVGGDYKITKTKNQVEFICHPTKGFQPNPGKVWVKKLTWQCLLDYVEQDNTMTMNTKWIKK